MKYLFLILTALLMACPSPARADIIILCDGTTITGTLVEEDWKSFTVQTPRGRKKVEKKDIQLIRKPNGTTVSIDNSCLTPYKPPPKPKPIDELYPSNDESVIKLSYDTDGVHRESQKLSVSGAESSARVVSDVDPGWEVAAEYIFFSRYAGVGGGASVQLPRATTNNGGEFNFIPVYLLVNLRTPPNAYNFLMHLIGHVGYNFLQGEDEYKGAYGFHGTLSGGLYYAYGFGLSKKAFRVEILRAVHKGLLENDGFLIMNNRYARYTYSSEIEYTKTSLSLMYAF